MHTRQWTTFTLLSSRPERVRETATFGRVAWVSGTTRNCLFAVDSKTLSLSGITIHGILRQLKKYVGSCSGFSAAFTIDPTRQGGEEVMLVMELKVVPASKDVDSVCSSLANQIRSAINQEHSLGLFSIALLKTRTVPKTSSGKIARAWCRKGYVAGTLQVV